MVCRCENSAFNLFIDDREGVAVRQCTLCHKHHIMLDGEEYINDTGFYQAVCSCDEEHFEITVGVSLYPDGPNLSNDVRWLYIGCRCLSCGLTGCYADWKNEYIDYRKLLRKA